MHPPPQPHLYMVITINVCVCLTLSISMLMLRGWMLAKGAGLPSIPALSRTSEYRRASAGEQLSAPGPSGPRDEPPGGPVGSTGAFRHCPTAPGPSRAAGSHSCATKERQQAPLGTKPNLRDTGLRKLFLKKPQSKALGCPVSADTRYGRLRYDYLQAGFVRCGSPECHTCSQIPAGNNAGATQGKASSVPPGLRVNIKCRCWRGGRGTASEETKRKKPAVEKCHRETGSWL